MLKIRKDMEDTEEKDYRVRSHMFKGVRQYDGRINLLSQPN